MTFEPSDTQLRDFVDLTLANEIEIALPDDTSDPPPWIAPLVAQMEARASPEARRGARRLLRRWSSPTTIRRGPGPVRR